MRIELFLDTSPVEELLVYFKKQDPAIKHKLLNNRGIRYMLYHHNLSSRTFLKILQSAVTGGKESFMGAAAMLHRDILKYIEKHYEYEKLVNEIKASWSKVRGKVSAKVEGYLPDWAEAQVKVYLVPVGDDAYGVNPIDTNAVVINMRYFKSLEVFIEALAHEVHHKALWKHREAYARLTRNGPRNLRGVFEVINEVVGEGVASIISPNIAPFQKYRKIKNKGNSLKENYRSVEEAIIMVYREEMPGEEAVSKLYPNMGPIYMVGIDMALTIEKEYGTWALREVLDDPSVYKFFKMFNQASSKTVYKYTSQTLKIIKQLQQRMQQIL